LLTGLYKNNTHKSVLAILALVIAMLVPNFSHAYTGITIVMSSPTSANLEFIEAFKVELVTAKSTNLRVKVIDLSETEKLVVAENSELVIALGVKAIEASSKLKQSTPVLGVFTPLPTFNSMLANSRRVLGNFSAIVLDQPYARRFSLIKTVMPEAKNLGVLLGPNSSLDIDELRESGDDAQFNIMQENIQQQADLIPNLTTLLEITDALMAIPDSFVYTRETAQPILLTSYRHQKPVFGFSQSYVRAGALAAVYSTSRQMAKQAAEIAIKSQQSPGILPPPQAPKYFSVALNYQVARSLNIQIADESSINKKMLALESLVTNTP
jgi:putative tryptophan/tyrosine transport system substrate-binding protein